MKRSTFIIIGIIMAIILIAVWAYVLLSGSPKNVPDENFADFNLGNTTDPNYNNSESEPGDLSTNSPTVQIDEEKRLHQLTIRPTIGSQEILDDQEDTTVLYVESGTGHVFKINLETGEESRLSGTTIPNSRSAAITPDGSFMMVKSGSEVRSDLLVGNLSTSSNSFEYKKIDDAVLSFKSTSDNTFLYAVQTNTAVIGKHYYPISDISETLFTIPFRQAHIVWGERSVNNHYVYPKASSQLDGFLYKVTPNKMDRLPVDGPGMTAVGSDAGILFSRQKDGLYQTYTYNLSKEVEKDLPITVVPEKCISADLNTLYCGYSTDNTNSDMPDSWYKGLFSFADNLLKVVIFDDEINSLDLLTDTEVEVGRDLDIINLQVSPNKRNVYFLNKNDQTLWLYKAILDSDLIVETPEENTVSSSEIIVTEEFGTTSLKNTNQSAN